MSNKSFTVLDEELQISRAFIDSQKVRGRRISIIPNVQDDKDRRLFLVFSKTYGLKLRAKGDITSGYHYAKLGNEEFQNLVDHELCVGEYGLERALFKVCIEGEKNKVERCDTFELKINN